MIVAALLCVLATASQVTSSKIDHVIPKHRTMELVEGAPTYPDIKITNGNQATRGQFPYQVGLILDNTNFCGGSIISEEWILTAAHCGYGVTNYLVYVAAQNLYDEIEGHITVVSSEGYVHQGYIEATLTNDVAVVKLSAPLVFNDFVQKVTVAASTSGSFEGVLATVSGWGRISDSSSGVSDELNFVDLTIISNDECSTFYGTQIVVSGTICAMGGDRQGICNGDSGGPLVVQDGGITTQVGVVSFTSSAGCESGNPSGFARVSEFTPWIQETTGIVIG